MFGDNVISQKRIQERRKEKHVRAKKKKKEKNEGAKREEGKRKIETHTIFLWTNPAFLLVMSLSGKKS